MVPHPLRRIDVDSAERAPAQRRPLRHRTAERGLLQRCSYPRAVARATVPPLGRDSKVIRRYVFPDGELLDVGELVALAQEHNLEVHHVESLREHYALTTRRWLDNLESNWDQAVTLVGAGRARVWRLYLAGAAVNFELGSAQIHQVLAVNTALNGSHRGENGLPLRLIFERQPLSDTSGESRSRADSPSTSTTLQPHRRT